MTNGTEMPIKVILLPYICIGREMRRDPKTAQSGGREAKQNGEIILHFISVQFKIEIIKLDLLIQAASSCSR